MSRRVWLTMPRKQPARGHDDDKEGRNQVVAIHRNSEGMTTLYIGSGLSVEEARALLVETVENIDRGIVGNVEECE